MPKPKPPLAPPKPPAKNPAAKRAPAVKAALYEAKLEPVRDDLKHLAELELWSTKNNLDGHVPLYASVNIGPIAIDAGGRHYRMFVRWATLQLRCDGFDAAPQSARYKRALNKSEAKAHAERLHRQETNVGFSAKVAARLGIKWLSVSGEAGGGLKNSGRETQKLEATIELPLVQNLPNLAWRIGDTALGDIRKLNGFLEGDYLYADCPEKEPLCQIVARKQEKVRTITGSLSVSIKDGVHVVLEGRYASDNGITDDERDGAFTLAFKDRLRSLALLSGTEPLDRLVIAKHTLKETSIRDAD